MSFKTGCSWLRRKITVSWVFSTMLRGTLLHLIQRDVEGEVGLVRLQHRRADVLLASTHQLDLGDLRLVRPPVVLVRLEQQVAALHPLGQQVRPAADSLGGGGLQVRRLQPVRRRDRHPDHPHREDRVRFLAHDVDRELVDLLRALHGAVLGQDLAGRLRVRHVLDGRHHGVGVERLAVGELDALAQLEAPGLRIDRAPALRQLRHDLALGRRDVTRRQMVVDVVHHEVRDVRAGVLRDDRVRLGLVDDDDLALGGASWPGQPGPASEPRPAWQRRPAPPSARQRPGRRASAASAGLAAPAGAVVAAGAAGFGGLGRLGRAAGAAAASTPRAAPRRARCSGSLLAEGTSGASRPPMGDCERWSHPSWRKSLLPRRGAA